MLRQRKVSSISDDVQELDQPENEVVIKQKKKTLSKVTQNLPGVDDMDSISFRLILWLVAMGSIALVEGILGVAIKKIHVVIDFFNIILLIITLSISVKAIDFWSSKCKEKSKQAADIEGGRRS